MRSVTRAAVRRPWLVAEEGSRAVRFGTGDVRSRLSGLLRRAAPLNDVQSEYLAVVDRGGVDAADTPRLQFIWHGRCNVGAGNDDSEQRRIAEADLVPDAWSVGMPDDLERPPR